MFESERERREREREFQTDGPATAKAGGAEAVTRYTTRRRRLAERRCCRDATSETDRQ